MSVTLNIVIEHLKARCIAEPLADAQEDAPFRFDRAVLVREGERTTRTEGPLLSAGEPVRTPSSSALFVGTREGIAAFREQRGSDARMLCICSSEVETSFATNDEGILWLRSGKGVAEVFAAVCECMAAVAEWVCLMEQDLLEGKGYQGVIDRAEVLIGNPMVLSDVGFRILAHTHRLTVPEAAVQEAIERGSFSHSSMESFRRKGRPSAWRSFSGINILDRPTAERPYPVVNYVFRVQGRYFMHLVMHCSEVPYSFGMRDLLQMLVDVMEMQIRRTEAGSLFEEGPSHALARLAAGAASAQVFRMLGAAGIGREGRFRVIAFDHGYGSDEPQLPVYAAFRIMEDVPFLLVGLLDGRILALRDASQGSSGRADLDEALERHCRQYGCRAGVSDAFTLLEEAPFAYRQALFALEADERRRQSAEDRPVASFDGCFADFIVLSGEKDEDLLDFCARSSVPARLRSAESRSDIDDFALLRAHLDAGLRPSVAAEALHLHRTTLLYRLDRIAKRFSIDLSDPVRTERLSLEYRLIDLGYGRSGRHDDNGGALK